MILHPFVASDVILLLYRRAAAQVVEGKRALFDEGERLFSLFGFSLRHFG